MYGVKNESSLRGKYVVSLQSSKVVGKDVQQDIRHMAIMSRQF